MAVLLLQLQGHAGTEEVTVAVEALGPVVEAALVVARGEEVALVVARVEEAALVVAAVIGCTYNSRSTCSSSSRSSRTMGHGGAEGTAKSLSCSHFSRKALRLLYHLFLTCRYSFTLKCVFVEIATLTILTFFLHKV